MVTEHGVLPTDDEAAAIATLESTLVDAALHRQVEMVLSHPAPNRYRAVAVDGTVSFRRIAEHGRYRYQVDAVTGRDPLGDRSPDRFAGHHVERSNVHPSRVDNAYPHALDSIAQFFDSPHAPELVALHTSGHHPGTHLGEHGSLDVIQARAPFIAAGAGVANQGIVDRSTRTVNIAPTVAALLGIEPHPDSVGPTGEHRADGLLRRQDGDPETSILTGEVARHVVVFLLDGCNANLLFDVVESGEAPHLAALIDRGTAYSHGCMASLPTATLANHTTAVTGAQPGHTGVLHNTWFDRSRGVTPNLLDMGQMIVAMQHLDPFVETLYQAIERSRPGAFSTATFEFCDTGASFSSFGLLRAGSPPEFPDPDGLRHASAEQIEASGQYRFMSLVDHTSSSHTIDAWRQVDGNPLPTLSWCGLAITDEAGHESGPHGEAARAAVRDSDGRIGDVLAAVEAAGALDDTAVIVIADHGMEQNDPANTDTWDAALASTGVPHLDVEGFIYLR